MNAKRLAELRGLEGSQVGVALADGSRMDDCQLVSAGRRGTFWLFANSEDVFVPIAAVRDIWETALAPCSRVVSTTHRHRR